MTIASENGHENTVKIIIAYGPNINDSDKFENTPLHLGIKSTILNIKFNVDQFKASVKGREKIIKILLANKAEPNAKNMYLETPFEIGLIKKNYLFYKN